MPLCGSSSLLKSPSTLILPPKNACITACMSPWTNRERAVLYAIDTVTSGFTQMTGVYIEAPRRRVDVGIERGSGKRSLSDDEVDPDGSHGPPADNAATATSLHPQE